MGTIIFTVRTGQFPRNFLTVLNILEIIARYIKAYTSIVFDSEDYVLGSMKLRVTVNQLPFCFPSKSLCTFIYRALRCGFTQCDCYRDNNESSRNVRCIILQNKYRTLRSKSLKSFLRGMSHHLHLP